MVSMDGIGGWRRWMVSMDGVGVGGWCRWASVSGVGEWRWRLALVRARQTEEI